MAAAAVEDCKAYVQRRLQDAATTSAPLVLAVREKAGQIILRSLVRSTTTYIPAGSKEHDDNGLRNVLEALGGPKGLVYGEATSQLLIGADGSLAAPSEWATNLGLLPVMQGSCSSAHFCLCIELGSVRAAATAERVEWRASVGDMSKDEAGPFAAALRSLSKRAAATPDEGAAALAVRLVFEKRLPRAVQEPTVGFMQLGGTSSLMGPLIVALGEALKRPVPGTILLDFPTYGSLLKHLTTGEEQEVERTLVRKQDVVNKASLRSSSMILPGGVTSGEELRQLVGVSRFETGGPVPLSRWDTANTAFGPAKKSATYGNFIAGSLSLEHEGWMMSRSEASMVNPQQLLLLEHSLAALNSALPSGEQGDRAALRGARIGVYVGVFGILADTGGSFFGAHYAEPTQSAKSVKLYEATASSVAVLSGRVSYTLGLLGPCLPVDTACSASLVAMHCALPALAQDECSSALVAGVGLLDDRIFTAFSNAGMLSETGRCHSFDSRADGYSRAEGCVGFVLTTLSDDQISPEVLGTSVLQDGPSASLTAPNGAQQRRLIQAVKPSEEVDSTLLEAHGTGTALGDPVEIGAARAALENKQGEVRVNSLKANTGHLEASAAVAGLASLLAVCLKKTPQREAGPCAQLMRLNPHLSVFDLVHFCIATELEPQKGAVLGRVSSFGYSGTIAHGLFSGGSAVAPKITAPQPSLSLYRTQSCRKRAMLGLQMVLAPLEMQRMSTLNNLEVVVLEARLSPAVHAILADHVVAGTILLPGVGFVEIAMACSHLEQQQQQQQGSSLKLANVSFVRPCALATMDEIEIDDKKRCLLRFTRDGDSFEISSSDNGAFQPHCLGSIDYFEEEAVKEVEKNVVNDASSSSMLSVLASWRAHKKVQLATEEPQGTFVPARIQKVTLRQQLSTRVQDSERQDSLWARAKATRFSPVEFLSNCSLSSTLKGAAFLDWHQLAWRALQIQAAPSKEPTAASTTYELTWKPAAVENNKDYLELLVLGANNVSCCLTTGTTGSLVVPQLDDDMRGKIVVLIDDDGRTALDLLLQRVRLAASVVTISIGDSASLTTMPLCLTLRCPSLSSSSAARAACVRALLSTATATHQQLKISQAGQISRQALVPIVVNKKQSCFSGSCVGVVLAVAMTRREVFGGSTGAWRGCALTIGGTLVGGLAFFAGDKEHAPTLPSLVVPVAAGSVGQVAATAAQALSTISMKRSYLSAASRATVARVGAVLADALGGKLAPPPRSVTGSLAVYDLTSRRSIAMLPKRPRAHLGNANAMTTLKASLSVLSVATARALLKKSRKMSASKPRVALLVGGSMITLAEAAAIAQLAQLAHISIIIIIIEGQAADSSCSSSIALVRDGETGCLELHHQKRDPRSLARVGVAATALSWPRLFARPSLRDKPVIPLPLAATSVFLAMQALGVLAPQSLGGRTFLVGVAASNLLSTTTTSKVVVVKAAPQRQKAAPQRRRSANNKAPASSSTSSSNSGVLSVVAGEVADLLGKKVADDAPLMSAGLDSLGVGDLTNRLSEKLATDLPSTLLFDHPTINAIVLFVGDTTDEQLSSFEPPPVAAPRAAAPRAPRQSSAAAPASSSTREAVVEKVRAVASDLLGVRSVAVDTPLMSAGLDSIGAADFGRSTGEKFGLDLPSTLMFDYPTITAVAGFVSSQLVEEQGEVAVARPASSSSGAGRQRPRGKKKKKKKKSDPASVDTTAVLSSIVAAASDLLGAAVEADQGLMAAGLDSIATGEFTRILSEKFNADLPSTLLFDHPTPSALATFIATLALPEEQEEAYEEDEVYEVMTSAPSSSGSFMLPPPRIVSSTLELPSEIQNVEDLRELVGRSGTTNGIVPLSRWDASTMNASAKYGSFIRPGLEFDLGVLDVVNMEAQTMDPQQAVLMEVGYEALAKATPGSSRKEFMGKDWGVYIGSVSWLGDLATSRMATRPNTAPLTVFAGTSAAGSVASGRISYSLGLTGPCMTLDTACSSSLTALHLASTALQNEECERALSAGVLLISEPVMLAFSTAGMLSARGRCHTFDSRADGYCRGEGCGAVVLEAAAAGSQGDVLRILATGVQQDGSSASLTAPNGSSQRRLLERVTELAAADDNTGHVLESHGTGTALGDPIEVGSAVNALCRRFYKSTKQTVEVQAQSLKANIGHLEASAAAAGLATLLATPLGCHTVAPNNQLVHLNVHLNSLVAPQSRTAKAAPFRMPIETTLRTVRNATGCLSSFGFSGTIAHGAFSSPKVSFDVPNLETRSAAPPSLYRTRTERGAKKKWDAVRKAQCASSPFAPKKQKRRSARRSSTENRMIIKPQTLLPPPQFDVGALFEEVMGRRVDPKTPLMDAGLDSLVLGEVTSQLERAVDFPLPATLFFDYPTLASLEKYVSEEFALRRRQQQPKKKKSLVDAKSVFTELLGRELNPSLPFMDAGLDSLVLGEAATQLERLAKRPLPVTLFFDYPTLSSLESYFEEQEEEEEALLPTAADVRLAESVCSSESDDMDSRTRSLVLSLGTTMRSSAGEDLRSLFELLDKGCIAMKSLPPDRYDEPVGDLQTFKYKSALYGGFIENVELFDASVFGCSRAESSAMDAQQRQALEVGFAACISDGLTRESMEGSEMGCYMGIQTDDFAIRARRAKDVSPAYLATGANHAVASGRLPYVLGLRGPSMAITTACSTALVCIVEAVGGIATRQTDSALVCSVNLNLALEFTVGIAVAGMLSEKGRCHTLDERADGYARAEGCSSLVLRAYFEDEVGAARSVLNKVAVRSDGRSASLTAPSGIAQQVLLRAALQTHSDGGSSIHVEMHGTGTALGDPIEVGALHAVRVNKKHYFGLAAAKSNTGHSETNAGLVGLGAVVSAALINATSAPCACLLKLNSRLNVFRERLIAPVGDKLPRHFIINEEDDFRTQLCGGVSSFGFSGAIAHLQVAHHHAFSASQEAVQHLSGYITASLFRDRAMYKLPGHFRPAPRVQAAVKYVEEKKEVLEEKDEDAPMYEVEWCTPRPGASLERPNYVESEDEELPVLVIGAGIDGMLCARALQRHHIDFVVFERDGHLAGVWQTQANVTSKVQTGLMTYHPDLLDESAPHVKEESNFAPAVEVCAQICDFARRYALDTRVCLRREVLAVEGENPVRVTWRDSTTTRGQCWGHNTTETKTYTENFRGVLFACGTLKSVTLAPELPLRQATEVIETYGVAADMLPSEIADRHLAIAGHGAYGVENVRSGIEHGAKSMTLICRHRHSVLPRCAVWMLDAGRQFDPWTEMAAALKGAGMSLPLTTDRAKRPAVSDQYYVALKHGATSVIHGSVAGYDPCQRAVVIETRKSKNDPSQTLTIKTDVFFSCYGFSKETSKVNETMRVRELNGFWVNGSRNKCIVRGDLDVQPGVTPLSASNIPFASFIALSFAHFLRCPESRWLEVAKKLPKAGPDQDTTSFAFFGQTYVTLMAQPDVRELQQLMIRRIQHGAVRRQVTWSGFVEDCAADARRYDLALRSSASPSDENPATFKYDALKVPPPHPQGYGSRSCADHPGASALRLTVIRENPPTHATNPGSLVFQEEEQQISQLLTSDTAVLVHPTKLETLAVLLKAIATTASSSDVKLCLILEQRFAKQFIAQTRVARFELGGKKICIGTVHHDGHLSLANLASSAWRPDLPRRWALRNGDARIAKDGFTELEPVLKPYFASSVAAASSTAKKHERTRAVITGGLGALAMVVGAVLCEKYDVVLAARSPRVRLLSDPLVPRLAKLLSRGAVVLVGADVVDPLVQRVVAGSADRLLSPTTTGLVVHAAGALHDVTLMKIESWMAQLVLASKSACLAAIAGERGASGAANCGLVAFSSVAAIVGAPGQTAYSHANGAMDALVDARRLNGSDGVAVQWLAVRGVGMHQEVVGSAPGWTPLDQVERVALAAASALWTAVPATLSVLPNGYLSWVQFQHPALAKKQEALKKPEPAPSKTQTKKKKKKKKKVQVKSGGDADVKKSVDEAIKIALAAVLSDPEGTTEVGEEVPLMESGIDSMGTTEFIGALNRTLKVDLPEIALFEYPTLGELRVALYKLASSSEGAVEEEAEDSDSSDGEDIPRNPGMAHREAPALAIASSKAKLGAANEGVWDLLISRASSMGCLPLDRIHPSLLEDGGLDLPQTAQYGGFIRTAEWVDFDNEYFKLSKAEARYMDPQQRQLLEVGNAALVAAGLTREVLKNALKNDDFDESWSVGNFVGLQTTDFIRALTRTPRAVASTYALTGANPAIAAGRLPFILGLRGTSFAVDTACSTALVCLHEARLAYLHDLSPIKDPALVSSVNAMLDASITELVERAGMLSSRGRCHTFDDRADGYARGEGVMALVLRAVTDDEQHLLAATALRSDGRTASITAPSAVAQRELLFRCLREAPDVEMKHLECHGTGTALGDPIEVSSLAKHAPLEEVLGTTAVNLSGVKANLGHLEPAAGFAGLAVLLGVATHSTAPPNSLLRRLNPQLNGALNGKNFLRAPLDSTPVLLSKNKIGGAVSSFGFSGIIANARVIFATEVSKDDASSRGSSSTVGVSLYRNRLEYAWLDVLEPHVYGLDKAAKASSKTVGAKKTTVEEAEKSTVLLDSAAVFAGVVQVVQSLSEAKTVTAGDSYEDLGVDSIALTEVTRALAEKFDIDKLSPSFLFDYPTVGETAEGIMALLKEGSKAEAKSLITPFSTKKGFETKPKLLLWAGGQGDVSLYARLASQLGQGLAVYGIDRVPGVNVGDMARDMAPQLLDGLLQNTNLPFYLGGLSVGGWLAIETALHIRKLTGREPPAIFNFDGAPPQQFRMDCVYTPAIGASEFLEGRNAIPPGWSMMSDDEKVAAFLKIAPKLNLPINLDNYAESILEIAKTFLDAMHSDEYDPLTSTLPNTEIVAMRAAERGHILMLNDSDFDPHPHMYSWATPLMPNLVVEDIPGSHMYMLADTLRIGIIANTIKRYTST